MAETCRMTMGKITQANLNEWLANEQGKEKTLNCRSIGGFHVRTNQVSPKGVKASASFRIKYRVNGLAKTVTIGKVGEITLPFARTQAGIIKAQGKIGKDILKDRKEAKQARIELQVKEAEKLPSLQKWFDDVLHDRLYEDKKKSRIYSFKRWLAILGKYSLDQITVEVVANSLRRYGPNIKKESTDKKSMEMLKEFASAYAYDNKCTNPLANSKWSSFVKIGRLSWDIQEDDESSTRTAIEIDTFKHIINCLERLCIQYPTNISPLAVLFMAYSGMRPSDIVSLKWSHLKIEDPSYLHIKKVLQKTQDKKRQHSYIPISPMAVHILGRAKKLSGGDYIFSESTKAKGVANLGTVWWNKVRKEVGIKFVLYQLRHNIAHQIIRGGGSIADVAATLGNTVEICVRHYLMNDPKHAATVLSKLGYFKITN